MVPICQERRVQELALTSATTVHLPSNKGVRWAPKQPKGADKVPDSWSSPAGEAREETGRAPSRLSRSADLSIEETVPLQQQFRHESETNPPPRRAVVTAP